MSGDRAAPPARKRSTRRSPKARAPGALRACDRALARVVPAHAGAFALERSSRPPTPVACPQPRWRSTLLEHHEVLNVSRVRKADFPAAVRITGAAAADALHPGAGFSGAHDVREEAGAHRAQLHDRRELLQRDDQLALRCALDGVVPARVVALAQMERAPDQ